MGLRSGWGAGSALDKAAPGPAVPLECDLCPFRVVVWPRGVAEILIEIAAENGAIWFQRRRGKEITPAGLFVTLANET